MYLNIIDSRRRDWQKKIWKYIEDIIENDNNMWVREVVKKFWIWNVTLDNYFWQQFKLVKNKKIYIITEKQKQLFIEVLKIIKEKEINKTDIKTKRLLFAFLYYNLSKK